MKNLSVSQLKPMPGFVLVEPAQSEQKTASGIILPGGDSEKPQYGKVLAFGDCICNEGNCCGDKKDCAPCDMKIKKGDTVVYKKWGGNDVTIDDIEYQFLKYEDILAIVK
jgi:chaperonin GroES